MTNPTPDLSRERLEEMEARWHEYLVNDDEIQISERYDEVVALIAMAKRTGAAEHDLVIANARVKGYQVAADTMSQLADKLGRERDALREFVHNLAYDRANDGQYVVLDPNEHQHCTSGLAHPFCVMMRAKAALAASAGGDA